MTEAERTLERLVEVTATLKRVLYGQRVTWLEWSALDDAWKFCQARGIPDPENPPVTLCKARSTNS